MAFEPSKLVLVTGAPRSSTTAFHNALIAGGLYRGVLGDDMSDRDPGVDRNLYTDEYHPSMQIAIAWTSSGAADKSRLRQQLVAQVDALRNAFNAANGLMLKAPHYVFGIPAYVDAYRDALCLLYIHRSPFAIAASMLRHPHIGRQLPRDIGQCTDFAEFDLPRVYADVEVLAFAADHWAELSLFERALFVWYLYANAFLRNVTGVGLRFLVIRNEAFDQELSRRIVHFLGIAGECAAAIADGYRALPPADMAAVSLSSAGQQLWDLVKSADAELTALSCSQGSADRAP